MNEEARRPKTDDPGYDAVKERQQDVIDECKSIGAGYGLNPDELAKVDQTHPVGYSEHHPDQHPAPVIPEIPIFPVIALPKHPDNMQMIRLTCNESLEIEEVFRLIEMLNQDIKPRLAKKIEEHAERMQDAERDLQKYQQLNYRLINP